MAIARAGGDIPYDTTKWYMTKFEANVTGKICVAELGDQNYMYGVDGDQSSLSPVAITRTRQYDGDTTTNIEFVYYSDYDVTQVIIPQCGQTITETYNCHMVGVFDDHSGQVSNFAQLARAQMRAYFDTYSPSEAQGVGTVTLQTKAPSQLLTFTSQRLGKSFKYWIRGNQTLELWKPTPQPVSDTLWIFRNGAFTNAVIDGFDISQFQTVYSDSDLSQYFGTAYGIVLCEQQSPNPGVFSIDANNYLSREPAVSNYADMSYYIPVKPVSGYSKLSFEFKFSSLSNRADSIICEACSVINGTMTMLGRFMPNYNVYRPTDFMEYEVYISDNTPINYICIGGDLGGVKYKSIKVSKPSAVDYEILWQFYWSNGATGALLITPDDIKYYISGSIGIVGGLIAQVSGNNIQDSDKIIALSDIEVRTGSAGSISAWTSRQKEDIVRGNTSVLYNALVYSRLPGKTIPFEAGFLWYDDGPTENCIVKIDGTFCDHSNTTIGDYITFYNANRVEIISFNGTIKYKLNDGNIVTMSGSSGLTISMSQLLGISVFLCIPAYVPDPDWEILLSVSFNSYNAVMLIDSNFNCTCYESLHDVEGSLLRYTGIDQQGYYRRVYAKTGCSASWGTMTSSTLTNTTYQAGDLIISYEDAPSFARFVLAKKNSSAKIPYEIGLYWNDKSSASGEGCVIKANEAQFIARTGNTAVGDKLQIGYVPSGFYLNTVSVSTSFNGKIKNADVDTSGYWQEISGTSGTVLTVATGIAIAIPN